MTVTFTRKSTGLGLQEEERRAGCSIAFGATAQVTILATYANTVEKLYANSRRKNKPCICPVLGGFIDLLKSLTNYGGSIVFTVKTRSLVQFDHSFIAV